MTIRQELQVEIREAAERLRKKYYGGRGSPGSSEKLLSDLEQDACEVGDAIACELLAQVLQDQADAEHAEQEPAPCTVCGSLGERRKDLPRNVQTRRGKVVWREPQYYCESCRKAFFPSVESARRRG
jgi:hypothetical protein